MGRHSGKVKHTPFSVYVVFPKLFRLVSESRKFFGHRINQPNIDMFYQAHRFEGGELKLVKVYSYRNQFTWANT